MKRTAYFFLSVFLTALFSGCTHNNGDIGDWFGTWKLQSIGVNGSDDPAYDNNVLWKFQNNIVSMVCADDIQHTADCRYGTWEQAGDRLILDFTHSDDRYEPGTGPYAPLPQTYIKAGRSELRVIKLSGSDMWLQMTADDGTIYTYSLKKWG